MGMGGPLSASTHSHSGRECVPGGDYWQLLVNCATLARMTAPAIRLALLSCILNSWQPLWRWLSSARLLLAPLAAATEAQLLSKAEVELFEKTSGGPGTGSGLGMGGSWSSRIVCEKARGVSGPWTEGKGGYVRRQGVCRGHGLGGRVCEKARGVSGPRTERKGGCVSRQEVYRVMDG